MPNKVEGRNDVKEDQKQRQRDKRNPVNVFAGARNIKRHKKRRKDMLEESEKSSKRKED